MRVGLIGDLHGNIPSNLYRLIDISEPDILIQAGDIWDACKIAFPVPFYFITGNHEKEIKKLPITNHLLPSGLTEIDGIKIVALNSTPMPGVAPGPAIYSEEDYQICCEYNKPDIFLSHGCGFPFYVLVGGRMVNVEDMRITKLIQQIKPTYAVSGHNHQFLVEKNNDTTLIRLGTERTGLYYLIDIN